MIPTMPVPGYTCMVSFLVVANHKLHLLDYWLGQGGSESNWPASTITSSTHIHSFCRYHSNFSL